MKTNIKVWFTIIELIVVITILAILWTIGFVSFSTHLVKVRDTNRIEQLWSIYQWLDSYKIHNTLPLPDDYVEVRASWSIIWYQWFAWKSLLSKIWYNKWWLDPKDEQYFTYFLSKDKKNTQLMSFLEDSWNKQLTLNFVDKTYAADYKDRYPTVVWKKLWILIEKTTNKPIQEVSQIVSSWYIDIVETNNYYNAYFTDNDFISWTWVVLYQVNPTSTCKRIFDVVSNKFDWEFIINPYWTNINIYCNRTVSTRNFYSYVEDWDMENLSSTNWWNNIKVTSDKNSGIYSLNAPSQIQIISNNFTYLDASKTYSIEGYFKSIWTTNSRLYFWFVEYDKDFNIIYNQHVNAIPWTETTLSQDANVNDTSIKFNCDDIIYNKWVSSLIRHSFIAFDIDDSWEFNDLPNRKLSNAISNSTYTNVSWLVTKLWNICTFTFHPSVWNKVWVYYPVWTKIRMHISWWTFNYIASWGWYVPNTWTKFSWQVDWVSVYWAVPSKFRRWTKFIKVLILANRAPVWWENLLIDDIVINQLN